MSNTQQQRLGKGLEALIPKSFLASGKSITQVPITQVVPNSYQPRLYFDEASLATLAESIRQNGVAQPVIVRQTGDVYELVVGERRFRASQLAGLETIPAIIRVLSDKEALQLALIENIDREELSAIEVAKGYDRLIQEFGMAHQDLAKVFQRNRSTIPNTIRLLKLPEYVQEAMLSGQLSEGHARTLLGIDDAEELRQRFQQLCEEGLSVRDAEKLAKRSGSSETSLSGLEKVKTRQKVQSTALGMPVWIRPTKRHQKIEIKVSSEADFQRVAALLGIDNAMTWC